MKKVFQIISLAILAGSIILPGFTEAATSTTPNIILIFTDDLGYGDLSCYGQKLFQTPHIDRMAEEGMKFTSFYAGSPVCAPSRCSLLTGKHTGHAWIRHNINVLPLGQVPLVDGEVTIAELLQSKGYITAAMGKWSLGAPGNSGDPHKQGFDYFFGYYCQCYAHNYFPETIWRDYSKVKLKNKVKPVIATYIDYPLGYAVKKVDYSPDYTFKESLSFIEKNRNRPFFLYYPTTLPHDNGDAPEGKRMEVPDYGIFAEKDWKSDEKGYAQMIQILDKQVGILLDRLKRLNLAEKTLVIFTSDNGPTMFTDLFDSNGVLRGKKRDLYEGGTRIPFIAWQPGTVPAGVTIKNPAAMYDLLATFTELAGITTPKGLDGQSLVKTLHKGQEPDGQRAFYWEFYEGERRPKQSVRRGDWKLIQFRFDKPDQREIELYNLKDDIGETQNMAAEHPEIVKQLQKIIEREHSAYPNLSYKAR